MIKYLLPAALVLSGCTSTETTIKTSDLPTYCVSSIIQASNDEVVMYMPGYPHGMDDEPITVSKEIQLELFADGLQMCQKDDPRFKGL